MNRFQSQIVVLPCHSLEDFPTHETGDEASSLLASWTAIWHPRLIADSKTAPAWTSQDFVELNLENALIVVPMTCGRLSTEFEEAVSLQQAHIIEDAKSRKQIFADSVLADVLNGSHPNAELIDDFFALGYAALQVQIMTRQLRHSTTLDQVQFDERVVEAACSWAQNDSETARSKIAACFDLLLEERNNFYPAEIQLVDLTLTPPSAKVTKQLNSKHKLNFWFTGQQLEKIRSEFPDDFTLLKAGIANQEFDFAMAQHCELPTQLVSIESVVNQIHAGLKTAKNFLDRSAETYCSFKFTLNPQFPNLATLFNFENLVHTTFENGVVPFTSAPVINWQGVDGSNIASIATRPWDANSPDSLLKLGVSIGEMLDGYHHAILMFAHWPGRVCETYEDLIRCEAYGGLFGQFQTFSKINETIFDSGFSDSFEAEDYKYPILESQWNAKTPNPISRWAQYWQQLYRLRAASNLISLAGAAKLAGMGTAAQLERLCEQQNELETRLSSDHYFEETGLAEAGYTEIAGECEFDPTGLIVNPSGLKKHLAINRGSNSERQFFELKPFEISDLKSKTSLLRESDPCMVFPAKSTEPPILQNDIFVIEFDSSTGGIKSVNRHGKRGNLFSQHLAVRISETVMQRGYPRQRSRYSTVCCESISVDMNTKTECSVLSKGSLNDGELRLANFEQKVTIRRMDPNIYISVNLELLVEVTGNPWRNYIANRIAWANESATITHSENEISERVYQEKFAAPNFIEIRDENSKISLLPGGLPFHRRSHRRMFDSLLIVEHESQRQFDFAIAIDPDTSMGAATNYLTPIFNLDSSYQSQVDGWVFHLNCKNILLTDLKTKFDSADRMIGVTMRLQETEGRAGELAVSCPFAIESANRTNLLGDALFDLEFDKEKVRCSFLAYQYFQIEIRKKLAS